MWWGRWDIYLNALSNSTVPLPCLTWVDRNEMDGFQTQALPALRRRKPKLWTAPFRECRLGDVLLCRQRVHRRTMDRLPLNGLGTQRGSVQRRRNITQLPRYTHSKMQSHGGSAGIPADSCFDVDNLRTFLRGSGKKGNFSMGRVRLLGSSLRLRLSDSPA